MCSINCNYIIIIITFFILFVVLSSNMNLDNFLDYNINGTVYKVLDNNEDPEKAANLLNAIDNNLKKLIIYINAKYSNIDNDSTIVDAKKDVIKKIIKRLNKNYYKDSLTENFPDTPGKDVSYNLNKGNIISICLRNFTNPTEFHQFNDILFVSIHELAHSCNISYGHDIQFWYIFKILLENAIEAGIYQNVNYRKNNVNYCSMKITYNPIFDISLQDKFILNKFKF